jgi:predicted metalloendopeptidase
MATEHVMTPAALAALSPHLAWKTYFEMVGHRPGDTLNVTSPRYAQTVDAIVSDRPIADLRALLRWQFLRALGTALPPRLADERYRYMTMAGTQRGARSEECQLETIKALGVELSRARFHSQQTRSSTTCWRLASTNSSGAGLGPALRDRAIPGRTSCIPMPRRAWQRPG